VHAAAILGDRTPLEQYDVPTWCKVLHVNLTAPFILTQVLVPSLRRAADGSVIFVSSGVVKNSRPFWGAYAVAKPVSNRCAACSHSNCRACRTSASTASIPGRMRTPMRAAAYPGEDPNTLPNPESVAGAFMYLLSGESVAVRDQISTLSERIRPGLPPHRVREPAWRPSISLISTLRSGPSSRANGRAAARATNGSARSARA
jgi:NAD(P)-dependent dehydrogenase (short-subunit alcohol dehydrogenase family)